MNPTIQKQRGTRSLFAPLVFSALAAFALSSCNSSESGGAALDANGNPSNASNTSPNGGGDGVLGDSCASGDEICLAVHFVTYKDSAGNAVASQDQAVNIIRTMNDLFGQCGISFQIEKYEQVDPAQYGLAYGSASQSQTNQIRSTFSEPSNQLLSVTTGPWGTAVNAWTNMPGSGPYGAVMEASIVDYGGGIIYAHEFGHYLGLDHYGSSSNLMSSVIATSSTVLDSGQCQTARETATHYWTAMLR